MSLVPRDQLNLSHQLSYYLPHHAVIKTGSSTTKVRVVFDASSKTATGVSLNDKLMVGPKLQEDLFCLLLRFRTHVVAFTADIEKNVSPDKCELQRCQLSANFVEEKSSIASV